MIYIKNGLYFEHKPRNKESDLIGVFYNLDKDKKRIHQINFRGHKLKCVDGSPRWEKSIIKWKRLNESRRV